jgi:hypothetical protein
LLLAISSISALHQSDATISSRLKTMSQTTPKSPTIFPWGVYKQTEDGSWQIVERFRKPKDAEDYQKTLSHLSHFTYKVAFSTS